MDNHADCQYIKAQAAEWQSAQTIANYATINWKLASKAKELPFWMTATNDHT